MSFRRNALFLRACPIWLAGLLVVVGLSDEGTAFQDSVPSDIEPVESESAVPNPAGEFNKDQIAFFEERVRPLLVAHCVDCHGPTVQEGDLRLDQRSAILVGGASGPAVEPGHADVSLLIEAVRYESYEMPPEEPLSEEDVELLVKWVEEGAPWPSQDRLAMIRTDGSSFTEQDRSHWSFQPLEKPGVPAVVGVEWPSNDIDRFVLARLEQRQLMPAERAGKETLLRRLSFDLTGLPPTTEERAKFLADQDPGAYERAVDRLLASPRFGERWAQMWLDVVRYADSDGYKADFFRPDAWRYRDYVIRSFNEDRPYDQFIREQLAGDEIAPQDDNALIATGFLRHWIYEYNQRDAQSQWQIILDDVTETTADSFLAMGFSCARCHDHKYDPILQSDYFRLQAFFNGLFPRQDLVAATRDERQEYRDKLTAWETATADIRQQIDELQQPILDNVEGVAVGRFPEGMRAIYHKSADERTTKENQIWHLIYRQVVDDQGKVDFTKKLKDESLARWKELSAQLAQFDEQKPKAMPKVFGVTDWGTEAGETRIPELPDSPEFEPGFMVLFGDESPRILPPSGVESTGRRTALANWIASPENPLTARVMVNRIWQQYFGRGIAANPNDFGRLGSEPTHPELLDYLASELIENDWSLKSIHKMIVMSSTYRQASNSSIAKRATEVDPDNELLWKMNRRRLDAEQIRDALLAVSDELKLEMGGVPVSNATPRRSVYQKLMRNNRDPLLVAFDLPDRIDSVGQRNGTTTPNQALALMNNKWIQERIVHLSKRWQAPDDAELPSTFSAAMQSSLGRAPTAEELLVVESFYRHQQALAAKQGKEPDEARQAAWKDLCGVLVNTNEFLYLD